MKGVYSAIFIVLFLSSQQFFGLLAVPPSIVSGANRIAIPLMVWYAVMWLLKRKRDINYGASIVVILIGLFANLIFSSIENGTSVGSGFFAMQSFWFLGIYFVLESFSLKTSQIENVVISLALTYAVVYLIQLQIYPRPIIKSALSMYESSEVVELRDSRGTLRFRGPGGGLMMLGYFLLFNRYLVSRKIWALLGCIVIFTVLLYGGFRSLLMACVVASVFMYFRIFGVTLKRIITLLVAAIILFGVFSQTQGFNIIESMVEETKSQDVLSDDYIRWEEFQFFVFEMPRSIGAYFFGAGYPGIDFDRYSNRITGYALNKGLYWQDIGLIGLGVMVGPVVLIGIFMIGFYSIKAKLQKDNVYPAVFILYLFVGSFTSMEFYRVGMFGTIGVSIYLLDRFTRQTKMGNS